MEKSETFVIHILQGMDCMSISAFSLEAVKLLPLYTYILTFVDITEYLTVKYFSFRVYIDCLSCSIWEESRNTLLSLLLLAYTGYPLVEYALIACCCYCIGSFFCMNLLCGYIVFFLGFQYRKSECIGYTSQTLTCLLCPLLLSLSAAPLLCRPYAAGLDHFLFWHSQLARTRKWLTRASDVVQI